MWRLQRPDSIHVLKDKKAYASLNRYFNVMQNHKMAKFKIAKKLAVNFEKDDSTPILWKTHQKALENYHRFEERIDRNRLRIEELEIPEKSFLDLKIEIARRILGNCHFCTRKCHVDRVNNELGYCKSGNHVSVTSMFPHMGEEPELVPSGTIFTQGCTMKCLHCQNWTISQWKEHGAQFSSSQLATAIEELRNDGCRNVNLVGGDPTPWLTQWLEAFRCVNINVPVIWNSNSYYSKETANLLAGFVDLYLLDFKYGNNECSKKISDAPKYWEACTRNHIYGKKHGEIIIRMLILPSHLYCCSQGVFKWIKENLGASTRTNIMFQYRPEWRAKEITELGRSLNSSERKTALELAKNAGLLNIIT
jgi:putative pyruvate formate lyase activating enzyme